jgi:hypothetical protein
MIDRDNIGKELKERYRERENLLAQMVPLSRRMEIVDAIISTLERLENGKGKVRQRRQVEDQKTPLLMPGTTPNLPSLKEAAFETMRIIGRPFNEDILESEVRARYPALKFARGSIRKPIRKAREADLIKLDKANEGNRSQAVYIWNEQK